MTSLRDLRARMKAVRQTLQVTKAMSLISTLKLRRGRRMLEDTEPYFARIQKSMFDILSCASGLDSGFFRRPGAPRAGAAGARAAAPRAAIVVITSDRGLAGAYNANVFRYVDELCEKVENPALILVGAVGHRHYAHELSAMAAGAPATGASASAPPASAPPASAPPASAPPAPGAAAPRVILEQFSFQSRLPTIEDAEEIAAHVAAQYLRGAFGEVHVVYTHMYNAIKILPTEKQVFPLDARKIQSELSGAGSAERANLRFEFIPSEREVFDALVPRYVKGIIYGCMVEAYASEHSARLTAMSQASKSAEQMLADLQIAYNRARQAGITQEMAEIIGGSAALAGRD